MRADGCVSHGVKEAFGRAIIRRASHSFYQLGVCNMNDTPSVVLPSSVLQTRWNSLPPGTLPGGACGRRPAVTALFQACYSHSLR